MALPFLIALLFVPWIAFTWVLCRDVVAAMQLCEDDNIRVTRLSEWEVFLKQFSKGRTRRWKIFFACPLPLAFIFGLAGGPEAFAEAVIFAYPMMAHAFVAFYAYLMRPFQGSREVYLFFYAIGGLSLILYPLISFPLAYAYGRGAFLLGPVVILIIGAIFISEESKKSKELFSARFRKARGLE